MSSNAEEKKEDTSAGVNQQESTKVNLYFVIDTTGSMGSYIASLNQVLEQICRMIKILFGGTAKLHIVAYKDYCDAKIMDECHSNDEIQQFVATSLRATGGGDTPEAAKTALNSVYDRVRMQSAQNEKTLVFVYTDAPPHHAKTGSSASNIAREKAALKNKQPGFDWLRICAAFHALQIPFYTFIARSIPPQTKLFWKMLGEVVEMPDVQASTITKATIGCMNQLMGSTEPFKYAADFKLLRYARSEDELDYANSVLQNNGSRNENSCGKLLSVSSGQLQAGDFTAIDVLDFLANGLANLPKKLLRDEKFRDLVFAEFKHIFTKENIICISYNSVFGGIWRHLCRFREDERLKVLKNTFSLIIPQLSDAQRAEMQEWLEDSYDDTEEINELIKTHVATQVTPPDRSFKYVSLDAVDVAMLPTKKELLTIAHSLFGDIIQRVQQILTHLVVITPGQTAIPFDAKVSNSYVGIPCALPHKQFFSMLSHLIIPGTMFTLRPTLIIAMISYLSGNVLLKERARDILMQYKGQWIGPNLTDEKLVDFPEFVSVPFLKLALRCHRAMQHELLTDDESAFYRKLFRIYRLRLTRPKLFDVRVGFEPKLERISRDYKRVDCVTCKEHRSFTLMLPDGKCGFCSFYAANPASTKDQEKPTPAEYEDLQDTKLNSHLAQCFGCKSIYAVIDVKALNVRPKCHYCRQGVDQAQIPTKECSVCLNTWICPNPNYFNPSEVAVQWTCPCCKHAPSKATDIKQVAFSELIELYPLLVDEMFRVNASDVNVRKDMFSSMSLYKLYMKHKQALWVQDTRDEKTEDTAHTATGQDAEAEAADEEKMLSGLGVSVDRYDGKRVHNGRDILSSILRTVQHGRLQDMCCLCFEEKQLLLLESACGMCKNLMCGECLATWYKQLEPGKIVLPTHLLCPFCKQRPHVNTIKKYNKMMCAIVKGKKHNVLKEFNEQDYYGWCVDCYQIKTAIKRECLREAVPELKNFTCDDCKELRLVQKMNADSEYIKNNAKICPGCKAPTVKISGCNHITCNCGCHWCYECQQPFGEDVIYDHMDEAHGGMDGYDTE